jgi:hypothetical protein
MEPLGQGEILGVIRLGPAQLDRDGGRSLDELTGWRDVDRVLQHARQGGLGLLRGDLAAPAQLAEGCRSLGPDQTRRMKAEPPEVAQVDRERRLQEGACVDNDIGGALGVERFSGQIWPS